MTEDVLCPGCQAPLWHHSREEHEACRATLGGFGAALDALLPAPRLTPPPPASAPETAAMGPLEREGA